MGAGAAAGVVFATGCSAVGVLATELLPGSWPPWVPIQPTTGKHDVYLLFTNDTADAFKAGRLFVPEVSEGMYLMSVDSVEPVR